MQQNDPLGLLGPVDPITEGLLAQQLPSVARGPMMMPPGQPMPQPQIAAPPSLQTAPEQVEGYIDPERALWDRFANNAAMILSGQPGKILPLDSARAEAVLSNAKATETETMNAYRRAQTAASQQALRSEQLRQAALQNALKTGDMDAYMKAADPEGWWKEQQQSQRSLKAVVGPDGKTRWVPSDEAVGQEAGSVGGTSVTVSPTVVMDKAGGKYGEKIGENLVSRRTAEFQEPLRLYRETADAYGQMLDLLTQVQTGPAEQTSFQLAELAGRVGLNPGWFTDNFAQTQEFQAKAVEQVLKRMQAQQGPQTDNDTKFIALASPGLGKDTRVNQRLLKQAAGRAELQRIFGTMANRVEGQAGGFREAHDLYNDIYDRYQKIPAGVAIKGDGKKVDPSGNVIPQGATGFITFHSALANYRQQGMRDPQAVQAWQQYLISNGVFPKGYFDG